MTHISNKKVATWQQKEKNKKMECLVCGNHIGNHEIKHKLNSETEIIQMNYSCNDTKVIIRNPFSPRKVTIEINLEKLKITGNMLYITGLLYSLTGKNSWIMKECYRLDENSNQEILDEYEKLNQEILYEFQNLLLNKLREEQEKRTKKKLDYYIG